MATVLRGILLGVAVVALTGCELSATKGIEEKVGRNMAVDASLVHCTSDGGWLDEQSDTYHDVYECTFDDGTPKGCYDGDTGGDLTIAIRATDSEGHECDGL